MRSHITNRDFPRVAGGHARVRGRDRGPSTGGHGRDLSSPYAFCVQRHHRRRPPGSFRVGGRRRRRVPDHRTRSPRATRWSSRAQEVDQWQDVDDELFAKCTTVSRTIAKAVRKAFDAPRAGLLIAGLEVPHLHLHVVPGVHLGNFDITGADTEPVAGVPGRGRHQDQGRAARPRPRRERPGLTGQPSAAAPGRSHPPRVRCRRRPCRRARRPAPRRSTGPARCRRSPACVSCRRGRTARTPGPRPPSPRPGPVSAHLEHRVGPVGADPRR